MSTPSSFHLFPRFPSLIPSQVLSTRSKADTSAGLPTNDLWRERFDTNLQQPSGVRKRFHHTVYSVPTVSCHNVVIKLFTVSHLVFFGGYWLETTRVAQQSCDVLMPHGI